MNGYVDMPMGADSGPTIPPDVLARQALAERLQRIRQLSPQALQQESMGDPQFAQVQQNHDMRMNALRGTAARNRQNFAASENVPGADFTPGFSADATVEEMNRNYNPAISPRQGFAREGVTPNGVPFITDGRLKIPLGGQQAAPAPEPRVDSFMIGNERMPDKAAFEARIASDPVLQQKLSDARIGIKSRPEGQNNLSGIPQEVLEARAALRDQRAADSADRARNWYRNRDNFQAERMQKFAEAQAAGARSVEEARGKAAADFRGMMTGGRGQQKPGLDADAIDLHTASELMKSGAFKTPDEMDAWLAKRKASRNAGGGDQAKAGPTQPGPKTPETSRPMGAPSTVSQRVKDTVRNNVVPNLGMGAYAIPGLGSLISAYQGGGWLGDLAGEYLPPGTVAPAYQNAPTVQQMSPEQRKAFGIPDGEPNSFGFR